MIYLALVLFGLCFGSFVNALVWRLHKKRNFVSERSECTNCHHVLAWYDLIPVLSWVQLRGKCRYCRKPIDDSPVVELTVMALFVLSYAFWPYDLSLVPVMVLFGIWLVCMVLTTALAVYDIKWMLLPDKIMFPLIALGIVFGLLRAIGVEGAPIVNSLADMALGIMSVGGLYYVLHRVSNGAWVGFGDVKLGVFIGAALGLQDAVIALMVANLVGVIYILPGLLTKRLTRSSRVPFGPFLIIGFIVGGLFGERIVAQFFFGLL